MGTDRNTVIGFVLLGVLLVAYIFISTKNSRVLEAQRLHIEDSINRVRTLQAAEARLKDSIVQAQNPAVAKVVDTTGFNAAINSVEKKLTVENELLKIVFSNKGGQ